MTDSPQPFFAPVVLAYREDGWTPERQAAFIDALADTACVRDAAAEVGLSEQSAYRLRRRDKGGSFDAAWSTAVAQGLRRIGEGAVERALTGTVKRRYYHDQLIGEERVYNDRLIMWLLQNGDRVLGKRAERARIAADWDASLETLARGPAPGEPPGGFRTWRGVFGNWSTNFPPPEGFDGSTDGTPGTVGYRRSLTPWEEETMLARESTPPGAAARDAWFGAEPDEWREARLAEDEDDAGFDDEDWADDA